MFKHSFHQHHRRRGATDSTGLNAGGDYSNHYETRTSGSFLRKEAFWSSKDVKQLLHEFHGSYVPLDKYAYLDSCSTRSATTSRIGCFPDILCNLIATNIQQSCFRLERHFCSCTEFPKLSQKRKHIWRCSAISRVFHDTPGPSVSSYHHTYHRQSSRLFH